LNHLSRFKVQVFSLFFDKQQFVCNLLTGFWFNTNLLGYL
jgi:hypothetical protein